MLALRRFLIIATAAVMLGGIATAPASPVAASAGKSLVGNAVYKACVNKKSGEMRYLKGRKCPRGYVRIQWNSQGPQGPQGPAGAAGAPGPSNVYSFALTSKNLAGYTQAAPLVFNGSLPAGNYTFVVSLTVLTSNYLATSCRLYSPGGSLLGGTVIDNTDEVNMPGMILGSASTITGFSIQCYPIIGTPTDADVYVDVTAVATGTVSGGTIT